MTTPTTIEIHSLRQQYHMSQQELATRLGVSRPTLVKIEQGKRPLTLAEREKLEQIFSLAAATSPASVPSTMRIDIPQQHLDKFKQVLLYILGKVGAKPNVGLTVLYKLLYFIDFDYYEKYEEQLMGLTYIKNLHGPTPKEFIKVIEQMKQDGEMEEVKSKYFMFDQRKFLPRAVADLTKLSGRELDLIDRVLTQLADKSAKELSDYSHGDVPWLAHDDGEEISYESVFYRNDPYSVRQYDDEI